MSTAPALDTNASATPSVFNEEVLLMAEKIGELSDRFAKIESEFNTQTAPIDGAKAAQEAALTALSAALKGIEQLNFHVLQNNLGAVSTRIEKVDANWQAKARELGVTIKRVDDALVEVASQLRSELAAGNKSRVELGRNVATETGAVKTMLGEIGGRLASLQSDFAQRIEAARKEFATPTTLNPRGDWSPRETYERLDVVTLNGTSYIAQRQTKEKPRADSADWQILARRGAAVGNGASSFEPTSLSVLIDEATIKWDLGNPVAVVTLGGNRTLQLSNPRTGGTFVLLIKQDSAGGRVLTLPSIKWPDGFLPVFTTTANAVNSITLIYDGATYYGVSISNYA
jgi:hypothetical protein